MNRQIFVIGLITIFYLITVNAGVYKWTDEDGNVHYSDKPVSTSSKQLDIQSPSKNTQTGNESDRQSYQKRVLQSLTEERQRKEKNKADKKKEQQVAV